MNHSPLQDNDDNYNPIIDSILKEYGIEADEEWYLDPAIDPDIKVQVLKDIANKFADGTINESDPAFYNELQWWGELVFNYNDYSKTLYDVIIIDQDGEFIKALKILFKWIEGKDIDFEGLLREPNELDELPERRVEFYRKIKSLIYKSNPFSLN
ncbi:MAG: hypothetical protein ABI721_05610 [Candidatus Dojkabacteria bacterium]